VELEKAERRNVNRGFRKLRVWQDAISLYVVSSKTLAEFPFHLTRVAANAIDAAQSISRNIAEGYCRRSLKEYLNYLNIALGSCGELCSSFESFKQAGHITAEQYQALDEIHYKVENGLISLIRMLQKKQKDGDWEDSFE
jgi:four helix bundle protein